MWKIKKDERSNKKKGLKKKRGRKNKKERRKIIIFNCSFLIFPS